MRVVSLILLAVACDSCSPSAQAAPPSGDVIVRVFKGREVSPEMYAPVAGIVVAAHDRDGRALGVARTDSHGQVTFSDFPPDGEVTIAEPHAQLKSLRTVFGVRPGDVIDVPVEEPTPPRGWLTSRWTLYPGAAGYRLFDGCSEAYLTTGGTHRLELDDRCLSPWRSVSAVVVAEDQRGRHLAYALATGVSLEHGRGTQVALGPWKTQFVDVSLAIPSAPWASDTTVLLRRYDGTGASVFPLTVASDGTSVAIPAGFFDEVVVRHSGGNRSVVRSVPLTAKSAVAVDATTPPTLDIEPPVVDGSDVARPVLHTRALGASADMLTGVVRWANVRWTFVAAPDATTIVFPALPVELAPFTPSGAPDATFLRVVDHSHFASWDEARRQLRWSLASGAAEDIIDLGGFVAIASTGSP